jgi:hypothetical protein
MSGPDLVVLFLMLAALVVLVAVIAVAGAIGIARAAQGIRLPQPRWYLGLWRWHWPLAFVLSVCIAYVAGAGMVVGFYAIADVALHHQGWWDQVTRRVLPTLAEMMGALVILLGAVETAFWLVGVKELPEPPWLTTSRPTRT